MLNRLLGSQKLKPFFRLVSRGEPPAGKPSENRPSVPPAVIKIVHVGGVVEELYMAVPAARVMEKYPSFVLARPNIFRRPWESVVRPEEILLPGQKFYVIPRRTVRKLRRRILPRSEELSSESFSGQYQDVSNGDESENRSKDGFSWSFTGVKSEEKAKAKFPWRLGKEQDIDKNHKIDESFSLPRRRTAKKTVSWEPSLTVIREA
ncbi:hypothetical protein H6P81_008497 [Aristolochia fimbriata]|uniref:Uncharacterized protein n=1 Tax=Aristolochia fimbriata TaxID=158543 RepID=A0AAV7ELG6_ARIFI|nr:hypothetical protein H6P81_008497 [Aristolochia fimbriata]